MIALGDKETLMGHTIKGPGVLNLVSGNRAVVGPMGEKALSRNIQGPETAYLCPCWQI